MKRRNFVKTSLLASPTLAAATSVNNTSQDISKYDYRLKYAPHLGMFKHHAGDDPIDQLKFMADQGFTAFEDNEMRNRPIEQQEKMAKTMSQLGIQMGVFVAHKIYWHEPNLASGKEEWRTEFLQSIKDSVDVAKRVNAKWMTVVPGHLDLKLDMGYQTANVMDILKRACEILEPHKITMVLEPLNFRDHPGLFLAESPQAYQICKAVNSPSCKILFDIYHQQIQEGNLIPNIESCWDEIAYYQIGDNPGRNEPTTGEINYKNVFKFHGNSMPNKAGERAVINAYREVSNF